MARTVSAAVEGGPSMRRSIRLLQTGVAVACAIATAALVTILAAPGSARAQDSSERITSYDTSIDIQRDGSILVNEKITYDFGANERHGIFRKIPVRFRYNSRYDRIYPLEVQSVYSPDAPDQYDVTNDGPYAVIKIGDPDQTVTGQHEYMISYLVRGSLNAFADHDELYWNAVGDQWDVPIDKATVRVTAPVPLTRVRCFSGPAGSTSSCTARLDVANGVEFGQVALGPQEGMTVVAAIPKGVVVPAPLPILKERWSLQRAFALTPASAGASGGLLAVLAVLVALVLVRGRDRRYSRSAARVVAGTPVQADEAVPLSSHDEPAMESAPPMDVRPGQAGTLLDGVANPRDVTGTIVDLAVRGYLRMEDAPQLPADLRRDAPPDEAPADEPTRYDAPPDKALADEATRFEAQLDETGRDWRLVRLNKTGGLLNYEQILLDGLFKDASTASGAASTLLSELGPAFTESLKQAQDALYTDVSKQGWFTARPDMVRRMWRIIGGVLLVAGVAATVVAAAFSSFGLIPIPVALAGLVLISCARWMPVRTAKGTDLARRLLGFRRYITTATAAQAPFAGQPELLYDYLPYTIVFGCTKQWAAITAALKDADQAPSWYHSAVPYRPSTLASLPRSGYYFSSMHHFAMNTSNWLATHSSSSGGSGFSGGFSGGGGGGGGGGSW
jgi:uncharacterized membrane protein YgcG